MRLVSDAIVSVDPNMILQIVRVIYQDKIQDGRVPDERKVLMHENYTVHTIVFIPGVIHVKTLY